MAVVYTVVLLLCCIQVRLEQVERWLDAVQELLSRDATGMSDTESLREELNQCKVWEKCNKKQTLVVMTHKLLRNQLEQYAEVGFFVGGLAWMNFFKSFLSCSYKQEHVNEMEQVEGSLMQMGENVNSVQAAAVPGLARCGQDKLDECQARWTSLSKQVSLFYCL